MNNLTKVAERMKAGLSGLKGEVDEDIAKVIKAARKFVHAGDTKFFADYKAAVKEHQDAQDELCKAVRLYEKKLESKKKA